MPEPALLMERLNVIGQALEQSGQGLALLGLGSVGVELSRMDIYSDLDFFAIVQPGYKQRFVDSTDWLEVIHPVGYCFKNTADGCKLMFADGVFCEYAVFEPQELAGIPFAPGRIVWQAEGFDAAVCTPGQPPTRCTDREWLIGEALTNLYVGLCRYRRGEKLVALRFIQSYAVDRVLDLAALAQAPSPDALPDPFQIERRFEQRYPSAAAYLPAMLQGYDKIPESAAAILGWLKDTCSLNQTMVREIEALLKDGV